MGMIEATIRRFLYYPTRIARDQPPPGFAKGAREVFINSSDGNVVHGLYWPAPDGRPTILFLHGNAETVFQWALVREDLVDVDCGMLLIDYPGYGKSTGSPREEALYAAAQASVEHLVEEAGVGLDRIVVFGKSLGGGVATKVAADHEVLGVVLESTFRSIPDVVRRLIPIVPTGVLFKSERYESLSRLGSMKSPLLVIHGTRDALIPVTEGQALFDAAPEPKELFLVKGAGHNDVAWVAGPTYGATLRRWVDEIAM